MRNLVNLRYFSSVVPEAQQGTEENLVDLVFSVEEQSTSSVQFGLVFTGAVDPGTLPVSLYLKLENSNLFGEGRTLSVGTQLSNSDQTVDFSYSQSWIGNLPISFNTTLSLKHAKSNTYVNFWSPNLELIQNKYSMSYHDWSATVSTGLARRWTPDYAIITLSGGIANSLQRTSC